MAETTAPIPLASQIAAVEAYVTRCENTCRSLAKIGQSPSPRFHAELVAIRAALATLESIDHAR